LCPENPLDVFGVGVCAESNFVTQGKLEAKFFLVIPSLCGFVLLEKGLEDEDADSEISVANRLQGSRNLDLRRLIS